MAAHMIYWFKNASSLFLPVACGIALFCFGLLKGRVTGQKPLRSALQTLVIGALAAAVAFALARLVSHL
ncbi:MAG: VIT1/CCC1 transporter family protein [Candidatus Xenobia bacterium]